MLTLPRVAIAKDVPRADQARPVPRALRHDRLAARRREVGPHPEAVVDHAGQRDDGDPAAVVPADRCPEQIQQGDLCVDLSTPLMFDPAAGPADRRARAEHDDPRSLRPSDDRRRHVSVPYRHVRRVHPRRRATGAVPAGQRAGAVRGRSAPGAISLARRAAGRESVRGRGRLIASSSTRHARAASPSRFGDRGRQAGAGPGASPRARQPNDVRAHRAVLGEETPVADGLRGRAR